MSHIYVPHIRLNSCLSDNFSSLFKSEFRPILDIEISPKKQEGAENETDKHCPKHHFPNGF